MKKVFLALVLVGDLFAMTGCAKECRCTGKLNGETVVENTVELSDGKSCSDYNSYTSVLGVSVDIKCTPVLF